MKKCPACQSVYNDALLIKCTNCGADLIEDKSQAHYEQASQNETPSQDKYTNYNPYDNLPYKYCIRCGTQCDKRASVCAHCGMQFPDMYNSSPNINDKPSGILKVLCFFFPILGLILYLVNMNNKPISAKAYGKLALIGLILGITLYIFVFIASFLFYFIVTPSTSVDIYSTYPETEFFYSMIHSIF